MGAIGLTLILATAYLLSTNRRAISLRTTCVAFGCQLLLAFLVLQTPFSYVFELMSRLANWLSGHSEAGTRFVFGDLGSKADTLHASFAFQILPTLIFFSAIFAISYQLGIMQPVIRSIAKITQRLMIISGAESTSVVANLVMDQTTAPLTIKPFLEKLTISELFLVMTSGMAHASGPVLAAYVSLAKANPGSPSIVDMKHLLTATVITIPGSIMLSKMLVPEEKHPDTLGTVRADMPKPGVNVIEAIVRGTSDGLSLALMVAAIVVVFVSLTDLGNSGLAWVASVSGVPWFPSSMQQILGNLFAPVAWLIGIPWKDCQGVGYLMGTRTILNDFVAFGEFGKIGSGVSARSAIIATYALCGFANLTSVAVQVGAIGALAPGRRRDLARLGFRALAAATLTNWMAASIVGIFLRVH
jgi:concentrative nucleoside transporter, CNT family